MWELDHKENQAPKNLCFWTAVLQKTLESPLGSKEIEPVNPKGNQSWIFIGRTDPEAQILWPTDTKSWLIRKYHLAENWRQGKKRTTEDKMVGWYQRLNRHEFEQTLGDGEGQGSLACCSPWGQKESDTTEQLNNHHHYRILFFLIEVDMQYYIIYRCPIPWFTFLNAILNL